MTHIFDRMLPPRDPDGRQEAMALCGYIEECSGSGRHDLTYGLKHDTCPKCVQEFDRLLQDLKDL